MRCMVTAARVRPFLVSFRASAVGTRRRWTGRSSLFVVCDVLFASGAAPFMLQLLKQRCRSCPSLFFRNALQCGQPKASVFMCRIKLEMLGRGEENRGKAFSEQVRAGYERARSRFGFAVRTGQAGSRALPFPDRVRAGVCKAVL